MSSSVLSLVTQQATAHSRGLLALVVIFCLTACDHDAQRANPVDPQLTEPAVQLAVSLNDTTGAASVSWSRYAGEAVFRHYRVLRREAGLDAVDTLAVVDDVDSLSFVDATIGDGVTYSYRVVAVDADGFIYVADVGNQRIQKFAP